MKSRLLKTRDRDGKLHMFRLTISKSEKSYYLNTEMDRPDDDLYSPIIFGFCDEDGESAATIHAIHAKSGDPLKDKLPFKIISETGLETLCYSYNRLLLNFFICDHLPVLTTDYNEQLSVSASKTDIPHNCQFLEDFSILYENGSFSDFKINTRDKEFNVHKNILAARSSVFAKKFKKGKQVKNSDNDCMIIKMESQVVEEMLRYMYTGSTGKLCEYTMNLYEIGKEYDLPDLQNECVSYMNEHILDFKIIDLVIFARKHDIQKLIINITQFITQHPDKIFSKDTTSDSLNLLFKQLH